jgi:endonuclease YncB( thermonuclease family)/plasmid stability protein
VRRLSAVSAQPSAQAFAEGRKLKADRPNLAVYPVLLKQVRLTIHKGKQRAQDAVEREKVRTAWETGKLIQRHILLNQNRAKYGTQVIKKLSRDLEISERELYYMVEFFRTNPILRGPAKLSWSHQQALLRINDDKRREEIKIRAIKEKWSAEDTRRNIAKLGLAKNSEPSEPVLLEAKIGKLYTYRIVKVEKGPYQGQLALDLGFSCYLCPKEGLKFAEGDTVTLENGKLKKIEADPEALYFYKADYVLGVDGDTFHALIDMGFGITSEQKLRLKSLDAPEILPHERTNSRRQALGSRETSASSDGLKAKAALEKILTQKSRVSGLGSRVLIKTHKSDQFGRYLAEVWVNEKNINKALINSGLLVVRG